VIIFSYPIWCARIPTRWRICALAAPRSRSTAVGRGFSVLEVIDTVKRISDFDFKVEFAGRRLGDPAWVVANCDRARAVLNGGRISTIWTLSCPTRWHGNANFWRAPGVTSTSVLPRVTRVAAAQAPVLGVKTMLLCKSDLEARGAVVRRPAASPHSAPPA
jgi:hypothetical protein